MARSKAMLASRPSVAEVFRLYLLVVGLATSPADASPNHDELQAMSPRHLAAQPYGPPGSQEMHTCEEMGGLPWHGIRIGYELADADGVDAAIRSHIEDVVLTKSITYLQQVLQVRRVSAPLRAEPRCTRWWNPLAGESSPPCAEAEAPVCGPDDFQIPLEYLRGKVCTSRSTYTAGDPCPEACTECEEAGGQGICYVCEMDEPPEDDEMRYDFFVFVTINQTASCTMDVQAYATSCVQDQCDRPVFGFLNFCQNEVSLDMMHTDMQVSQAVHELTHALVFSSSLFRYFRNMDGTPRLPRHPDDPLVVENETMWSCSNSMSYTFPDPNGTRYYVDVSAGGVVDSFGERGLTSCPCPVGNDGMGPGCLVPQVPALRTPACVFKVVLPKVVQRAREHFDCPTLNGAELENQDPSACTIVGSHWEQRIFMGEVMAPMRSPVPRYFSKVTLALFEDSGWYRVDYSRADTLSKGVHWGYRQGCNFAVEKCLSGGSTNFLRHWCSATTATACSMDRRSEHGCADRMYQSLPAAWRYFPSSPNSAGDKAEADYCPMYAERIDERVCTDMRSMPRRPGNANFMREVFGRESRCLESTLHGDVSNRSGPAIMADPMDYRSPMPGCFEVWCSPDNSSYMVHMADLETENVTALVGTCRAGVQELMADALNGSIRCAPVEEICGIEYTKHTAGLMWTTTTTTTSTTTTTTMRPTTTSQASTTTTSSMTQTTTTTSTTGSRTTPPTLGVEGTFMLVVGGEANGADFIADMQATTVLQDTLSTAFGVPDDAIRIISIRVMPAPDGSRRLHGAGSEPEPGQSLRRRLSESVEVVYQIVTGTDPRLAERVRADVATVSLEALSQQLRTVIGRVVGGLPSGTYSVTVTGITGQVVTGVGPPDDNGGNQGGGGSGASTTLVIGKTNRASRHGRPLVAVSWLLMLLLPPAAARR